MVHANEVQQYIAGYQFRKPNTSRTGFFVLMPGIPEQLVVSLKFELGIGRNVKEEVAYKVADYLIREFHNLGLVGKVMCLFKGIVALN